MSDFALHSEDNHYIGKKVQHFKGNIYTVICFARNTDNPEEMVVIYHDPLHVWSRRATEFFDYVEKNGERIKRFTLL